VTFESCDVVVVPFPFTERAAAQRRPALVISKSAFNACHGHVVLAMITSAANSGWPSDIPILDKGSAGLRADSIIRFKLFTLDRDLVLRRIGSLAGRDRDAVGAAFGEWIM
jgi:mRNA interferase MazF